MPIQFPVAKIDIINSALAETRRNLVAVAEDGSVEWTVCSPVYDRALAVMLEDFGWGFATKVAILTPSPTPPVDTDWDTAYPLPQDLLHLIWVKRGINPQQFSLLTRWDTQLVGDIPMLLVNAQGGPPPHNPPTVPVEITAKYITFDGAASDAQSGTPLFVMAMSCFVLSGVYRGLIRNDAEADKMWQAGEAWAQRSRTRYAQQKPKRQFFNSRISASRRIRRPWLQLGNDSWGGGGSPGW